MTLTRFSDSAMSIPVRFRLSAQCSARNVRRDVVEQQVLDAFREQLEHSDTMRASVEEYNHECRRLAKSAGRDRSRLETRGEIEREQGRIADGVDPVTFVARLAAEATDIEAKRAARSESTNVVILLAQAADQYVVILQDLQRAACADDNDEAIAAAHQLVNSVRVIAPQGETAPRIDLEGVPKMLTPAVRDKGVSGWTLPRGLS
jgi:hypothetical protein